MELREGAGVFTPGGEEVGRVSRFILDPATNELTHIVVQKGWLLPEDKVVPFEMIRDTSEERLVLSEEVGDFEQLPPFEETEVIPVNEEPGGPIPPAGSIHQYAPAYYWYPARSSLGFPGMDLTPYPVPIGTTKRNIPEDTVPLKEGTNVVSSDEKHVGDVERLFVEEGSNKVTHFLISQGMLFPEHKLVPAHWVKSVEEDKVHLVVSSKLLERLPSYAE